MQRESNNTICLSPTTSTVTLIDDVINDDASQSVQTRNNSAIHIKILIENNTKERLNNKKESNT